MKSDLANIDLRSKDPDVEHVFIPVVDPACKKVY